MGAREARVHGVVVLMALFTLGCVVDICMPCPSWHDHVGLHLTVCACRVNARLVKLFKGCTVEAAPGTPLSLGTVHLSPCALDDLGLQKINPSVDKVMAKWPYLVRY